MTRDPQFGPMLMFGLGGIFVEVMKDVTFHIAPITEEEAIQMLEGTRSYGLLKGARGQSSVDLQAIADGSAAHQPTGDRFPADQGTGHQPLHRRREWAANPSPPTRGSTLAVDGQGSGKHDVETHSLGPRTGRTSTPT